jgi:uncharacterized cupredoxin-like copper-binding protein
MRRFGAVGLLAAVVAAVVVAGAPVAMAAKTPVKVSGTVTVKGTKDLTGEDPATLDVTLANYSISPTFTKAMPGQEITVNIRNSGTTTHTFTSKSLGVDVELAPGKSQTIDIPMPQRPGAYVVYCRIIGRSACRARSGRRAAPGLRTRRSPTSRSTATPLDYVGRR